MFTCRKLAYKFWLPIPGDTALWCVNKKMARQTYYNIHTGERRCCYERGWMSLVLRTLVNDDGAMNTGDRRFCNERWWTKVVLWTLVNVSGVMKAGDRWFCIERWWTKVVLWTLVTDGFAMNAGERRCCYERWSTPLVLLPNRMIWKPRWTVKYAISELVTFKK